VGKFDGQFWYRYDTKVYCQWEASQRRWRNCKSYSPGESLSDSTVIVITGDAFGNKYFGTQSGGLCMLDSSDTLWACYKWPLLKFATNDHVQAIAIDQAQHKWLGTAAGICELDAQNRVVRCDTASRSGLRGNDVYAIWIDQFQNKWIGTNTGLSLLDSTGQRWKSFTAKDPTRGPASDRIRTVTGDSDDNIWLGFLDGRGVSQFNNKWAAETQDDGLKDNFVFALESDSDGHLWTGTADGGLFTFDRTFWKEVTPSCPNRQPFQVKTLARGQKRRIWVGTHNCGLFAMSAQYGVENIYRKGAPATFPSNTILSIATQADTVVWVGTNQGLCRLALDAELQVVRCDSFHLAPRGLSDIVNAVAVDQESNVWVGTANGLGKFDGKVWTLYRNRIDLPVNALGVDSDGAIWVGTDTGISRFFNNVWRTFTMAEGLRNNTITTIATGPSKTIWCGTPAGPAVFDNIRQTWTAYTVNDGLNDNFISDITLVSPSVVWFSTWGGGLSRYHRTAVYPETQILTQFDITSKANVLFRFSGYDLNTPSEQLRYLYKFDHHPWKQTANSFVELAIEPRGQHTLQVKAIDQDGNEDPWPDWVRFTRIKIDSGGQAMVADPQRRLRLYFPPHSVGRDEGFLIKVTIPEVPDSIRQQPLFAHLAYGIFPDSVTALTPNRPITLTLLYPDSLTKQFNERNLALYHYDQGWNNRRRLGGTVDSYGDSLRTTITQFGYFALFADQRGAVEMTSISAEPRIFSPNGRSFDNKVTIGFDLEQPKAVTMKVYNLAGRLVKVICENEMMNAGRNAVYWEGADYNRKSCPSGMYLICLQAAGKTATKTVMVVNQ